MTKEQFYHKKVKQHEQQLIYIYVYNIWWTKLNLMAGLTVASPALEERCYGTSVHRLCTEKLPRDQG